MHIAILNHGVFPYLLGGMERHTHFLATHLCRLGARVDVIVPKLTPVQSLDFRDKQNLYNLHEIPWVRTPIWMISNYLYSRSCLRILKSNGYDAIYCQGFNGVAYLADRKKPPSALSILNMHGMEMFKTVGRWQTIKTTHMRILAKYQAKFAHRVISSGGRLTEETTRFLGVRSDRIDVIPNGVDLHHLDAMRAEIRTAVDRPQFVFIGRLAENKGVNILCEAFAGFHDADLIIVGSGPLEATLRARFQSQNIRFTGSLDDTEMFCILKAADCFLFASLYEGMPTVILEAMACGLPVIATDIGAVKTMVDDSNGIVVDSGDVEKFRQAIARFLRLSKDEQLAMGKSSRMKVEQNFSWPHIARMTLNLIEFHLRKSE